MIPVGRKIRRLSRPLAGTHQATDGQIRCADLEICVSDVTRAIECVERANLMSDGQAWLHVECRLGRLSPLPMPIFVMTLFARYGRCGHFVIPQWLCTVE